MPGPTDFVLEQLSLYNAKGTFFCIGNNATLNGKLFDQIKREGHTIGNHTFNHLKGWSVSDSDYRNDIDRCTQVVGRTKLFRPPYGRIKRSQLKLLTDFNIIMWDVLSHDYVKTLNAERCLSGTINATRGGSIIVFHDSYKAEKNLRYVLPRFLDHFSQRNFSFGALPEH